MCASHGSILLDELGGFEFTKNFLLEVNLIRCRLSGTQGDQIFLDEILYYPAASRITDLGLGYRNSGSSAQSIQYNMQPLGHSLQRVLRGKSLQIRLTSRRTVVHIVIVRVQVQVLYRKYAEN